MVLGVKIALEEELMLQTVQFQITDSVGHIIQWNKGAEELNLSGLVCRDENGIAQVASLPKI